jgi:hypothetical protein
MGPKLLEQARFLQARRDFARQTDLVGKVQEIEATVSVDDVLAKVTELLELLKTSSPFLLGPVDIERMCGAADGKLMRSPLAIYDGRANVLFLFDSAEAISSLTASTAKLDADGKLLLGLETPQLAKLLKGNKMISDDGEKQFLQFPFPKTELVLNGREAGTGITARLSLSRIEEQ